MRDALPPLPPGLPPLLARVPMGLGLVVEIGSGDGALGAWLAARDPAARHVATTTDPEAAAQLPAGAADLVVLHGPMADPCAAIAAAAPRLAAEGTLLVEIPNAGQWRLEEATLDGASVHRARPQALTFGALLAAIHAAGLVAQDLFAPAPEEAEARAFAQRIAPNLEARGMAVEAWFRRAAPDRWVLRAGRRAPQPLHLLAHALKPVGGVNDVRIRLPFGAAATWPGVTARIGIQPATPALPVDAARIVVLHRRLLHTREAAAFINHFRERGWVIVQEFDDDPAHWPVIPASNHFAFRGVHAVQTTTPALEALFRTFNDEVAAFPNTVAALPAPANFVHPQRLTLFLGALRREQDIAPFLPALNAVLAEAGERLAVEVIFDRATFEALATPHKRFHPLLPYDAYRALMARCEIAFLPLADTRFNNFKSDLKFVEAGAHGLCCLASPVVYGATIRDGETGLIVRDAAALAASLRALLADPARARAIGASARAWVRQNRMLANQTPQRLAWYRGLWARRAALDAALLGRAPELVR